MASTPTPDGTAFLVENPNHHTDDMTAATLAAEEAEVTHAPAPREMTIGTLHETPADPYQESDKAVEKERHALDMQYRALTKGYADADGATLGEVDAQMEAVHETYASYNAPGAHSAALKAAIARHDAEVKQRIERHAGGAPLLEGYGRERAKVPEYQRHDADTGSPEAQVARLTARVEQLTAHLKQHKTDYSTTRGLMAILSKRKQLLKYLRSNDKEAYERCLAGLGIRQLK